MEAKKEIRFIDSHYNELFRIPDGGYISITDRNGNLSTYKCRYIDSCHLYVGNNGYHICEFAERMEHNEAAYRPAGTMETFIYELQNGNAYDYICSHGYEVSKMELMDIIKEYIYHSREVAKTSVKTETEMNKDIAEALTSIYLEDDYE